MFVLIHSPLVGSLTWKLVVSSLAKQGITAIAPSLHTSQNNARPYWQQHRDVIVDSLTDIEEELILVGHSGAGVLLPAIGEVVHQPVAGYIFVDADLPRNGMSRLERFSSPQEAQAFRDAAIDGYLPTWGEEHLVDAVPDPNLRRRFTAELEPLPLAVYEEKLPVPPNWPDAPCGYLLFSSPYQQAYQEADSAGWCMRFLKGRHFQMLVKPEEVACELQVLCQEMGIVI